MRLFSSLLLSGLALSLILGAPAAWAWGPNGHRITAKVAEDSLSDPARAALHDIAGARTLPLLATWPDFIRSFPGWDCVKPWHFMTVEDGQDFEQAMETEPRIPRNCDADLFNDLKMPFNVVAAIDFFTAVLRGEQAETDAFVALMDGSGVKPLQGSVRLTALALLVHFVGDVHQPLHVGRGPDRGGNSITVRWFDQVELTNLHMVWDENLIRREALSYSEFSAFLEQEFADADPVGFGDGPRTWAMESVAVRAQVYDFSDPRNPGANLPALGYPYAAKQSGLVQRRLYEGGRRLAMLLEKILLAQ